MKQAADKQKPIFLNENQAFVRKGATDARADKNELRRLYRLSDGSLDTQVLKNYWIDDLDIESINKYKSELTKRESYKYYAKLNDEEFLTRIGVISKDYDNDGKVGITIGGLLFFGKNNAIIHTFPNFQLEFYDKSNLDKERWTYRISSVDEDLNIYTFFLKVENYLSNHLSNEFKLDRDGKRVDTFGSMFVALREATINMLMHADYFEDDHISLNSFSNYYEFYNPGKMKIQSDDFFTTNISITRNPIISKLFVQAGYGERAGHGGIKIFESSTKNNYRHPEIITDVDKTKLTIWKVDYADSFSNIQVDDRERAVIKAILKSDVPKLSHRDIESLTGYSRFIADKAINSLLEKNIISKSGNARSTRYSILKTKNQLVATAQAIPDILRNYFKR